ncbi:MAG: OsmC family protein [Alicyclobacillaceae bacterium]|nr:OsmC family protein [Alicyclobacillaceae bacterium]
MEVHLQWLGNRAFEAEGPSGHKIRVDAAADVGGEDRGPRPMELLLMGVGGCTGIDVAMILEKMRLHLERFEMRLTGERADRDPRRFTRIRIDYDVEGPDLTHDKVAKAIELSYRTYCSALHSLNAEFEIGYTLNGERRTLTLDEG